MTAADTTAQAQQAPTEAAGQELDALIAREVFGWEGIYQSHINFAWCGYPPGVTQKSTYAKALPKYSTDMNDAMRAAEAVGLLLLSDDGTGEGCHLYHDAYRGWVVMNEDAQTVATGETHALAIARAVVAVASQRVQEGQGEGK